MLSSNTRARRPRRGPSLKLRMEHLEDRTVPATLTLLSEQFIGGSGNESGTGISVVDTGAAFSVYTSGQSDANGGEGLLAQYSVPYTLATPSQVWNTAWPGTAGYDAFNGVAATSTAVYAAGSSYARTTDTVGDKEQKGITVSFPLAGGASTWDEQTPGAPGAFSYSGYEGLNAVASAVEGGETVLYVTGSSQSNGINGGRLYVSKLDAAGNVLWTRTDNSTNFNSSGLALAAFGGNVYVAGHNNDTGTTLAYLKKYDQNGLLVWTRTSTPGIFNGLTADAASSALYAVGRNFAVNGDFILEKWDVAGNLAWSRVYDNGGTADILNSVTFLNDRLYAAGSTNGNSAGGSDGVVLEIDPATGDLLATTLWGGAADDSFQGIAATPTGVHLVGTTSSYGSGGSDVTYVVYAVDDNTPPPNQPPGVPSDNDPSANSVAEGAANGSTVGVTANAVDPDGETVTYSLIDSADDRFAISSTTGVVTVADGTLLDGPASHTITVQASDGAGGSSTQSFTIAVTNVAPQVTLSGPSSTDEGETEHYTFTTSDPGADTFALLSINSGPAATISNQEFDGTTGAGSFDVTFLDGPSTATVSVQVEDSDGASSNVSAIAVAVANVNPTATSNTYSSSQGSEVSGNVMSDGTPDSDPAGANDPLLLTGFTQPSNGTVTVASNGSFIYSPDSTFAGTDSFTYTISDGDDGSATGTVTISVTPAGPGTVTTVSDTCLGGTAILIQGTSSNDRIVVKPGRSATTLRVTINGVTTTVPKPSGRIIVLGGAGDDRIKITAGPKGSGARGIANPAWLYGEDGNDRLYSGAGGGLLFGGNGHDRLIGGRGRDIMVGGQGTDKIVGNANDDILIAGFTTKDDRTTAGHEHFWCDITKEWNSNNTFADRVDNLRGPTTQDANNYNGTSYLLPEVRDDNSADDIDMLQGSSGNDWFIYKIGEDKVVGQKEGSN